MRKAIKAIAQNPLSCASLTSINCDLMGKRFLRSASLSLKIHFLVLP
ncbi:hypothetical protein ANA_C11430 [Anabaena sp. 90]|nr:hypothetical protein ANA_C11430 [Anabaena sp. 90]